MAELSLSVLEYEKDLDNYINTIRGLLGVGVDWLHVDVMRPPFIPEKSAFEEEAIAKLYKEFAGKARFDFHLMINKPYSLFEYINRIIPPIQKKQSIITIHREAYRDYREISQGGLGKYASKEFDLLTISTDNSLLDKILRAANVRSGELVYRELQAIRSCGYMTGLALEPGTSLENVSEEMAGSIDLLLLMGVSSGKGGQKYNPIVTDKIKEARKRYEKVIQVDGGMNDKTIPIVVKAGVTNLVVGSYITKAEDRVGRVKELLQGLERGVANLFLSLA